MRALPRQEKGEVPEDLRLVRAAAVDAAAAAAAALTVAVAAAVAVAVAAAAAAAAALAVAVAAAVAVAVAATVVAGAQLTSVPVRDAPPAASASRLYGASSPQSACASAGLSAQNTQRSERVGLAAGEPGPRACRVSPSLIN